MERLHQAKAVVTGASGGIGAVLSATLARAGMDLLLVAGEGAGLSTLASELNREGHRCRSLEADLRVPSECARIADVAQGMFGTVDILVNNAGVEYTSPYHSLSELQIRDVLAVNLEAPMLLTRRLLPGMLEQGRGHIVNMSSLAGKSGPAYQEPYSATKAALTAFTLSLRSSYRGTGVSASVICPGFVEAGIYARLKARSGVAAPWLLAGTSAGQVARAVIRAIKRDQAEVLVNRIPLRPMLALSVLSPGFGAWLTRWIGVNDFFRRAAESDGARVGVGGVVQPPRGGMDELGKGTDRH